jgi:hypothetical protein
MAWFKWVIEYDLAKQADAMSGLRHFVEQLTSRRWLGAWLRAHARALEIAGALVAALVILRLRPRRRARPAHLPRASAAALNAYQRALRALERRGHARGVAETGRELAARVERAGDPGAQPFASLVDLYYAARFGGAVVPPEELERLAGLVQRPPQV